MENLPKDPFILLSWVNMKLRDSYNSLHDLCDDLAIDESDIKQRLAAIGFVYDPINNRFS